MSSNLYDSLPQGLREALDHMGESEVAKQIDNDLAKQQALVYVEKERAKEDVVNFRNVFVKAKQTMSKAEEFIQDCTRGCSNELVLPDLEWNNTHKEYNPWLTPDQALKAVEIAREEIYDWLRDNVFEDKYLDLKKMGIEYAFYGYKVDTLINDLKQSIKNIKE